MFDIKLFHHSDRKSIICENFSFVHSTALFHASPIALATLPAQAITLSQLAINNAIAPITATIATGTNNIVAVTAPILTENTVATTFIAVNHFISVPPTTNNGGITANSPANIIITFCIVGLKSRNLFAIFPTQSAHFSINGNNLSPIVLATSCSAELISVIAPLAPSDIFFRISSALPVTPPILLDKLANSLSDIEITAFHSSIFSLPTIEDNACFLVSSSNPPNSVLSSSIVPFKLREPSEFFTTSIPYCAIAS